MGAMPWPTEYMFAVNHDHALHPHEWPPAEAKTIYHPSGHYSSSTVDGSVINDANKVFMMMSPNSLKPLPPHPGSPSAPQHTTAGRGDGALQHMRHFYLLMFLFSFLPKVLICCTSSEWGRAWAAHRRPSPAKESVPIVSKLLTRSERT